MVAQHSRGESLQENNAWMGAPQERRRCRRGSDFGPDPSAALNFYVDRIGLSSTLKRSGKDSGAGFSSGFCSSVGFCVLSLG